MMKIKSVNDKELLSVWIVGLLMFIGFFTLSGTANIISSVNLTRPGTEEKIVSQHGGKSSKIFYKSFVDKANWIYSKISSLKYVFKNLLIIKNNAVHVQFAANSFLVLFIAFLIGIISAVIFLFYPASQKTSLPA